MKLPVRKERRLIGSPWMSLTVLKRKSASLQ